MFNNNKSCGIIKKIMNVNRINEIKINKIKI